MSDSIKKDIENQQARVKYSLTVLIKGKNDEGKAFTEQTEAENVTRRGAFIRTRQPLQPGASIRLYDVARPDRSIAKFEVVWTRGEAPAGVGTKLLGSNENWMKFLLKNSIAVIEEKDQDRR